jgi:urease accessory protein
MSSAPLASKAVISHLDLRFTRAAGQPTRLRVLRQEPPLRTVRGFAAGAEGALAHLHNLSGGVLGGDHLALTVEVEPGAQAQVTSTGATRVYRHRPALPPAVQSVCCRVGKDALLELLPDALIPYAHARYHQQTRIELDEGAGLVYWELIAPGRAARGERFQYDELRLDLDIFAADRLIVHERARLAPREQPLASPARLGPFAFYAACYLCRVGVAQPCWLDMEAKLAVLVEPWCATGDALWGVSALAAHGVVVRAVGNAQHKLAAGLVQLWQCAKQELYQTAAVLPRKVY